MKATKKILASAVAATLAVSAMAPVANAETSASVGVSNLYLWRGNDLGAGSAVVSGDLSYTSGGLYSGVWASSGDINAGSEYDLYLGYGADLGGVSVDVSLWSYNYAQVDTDFGDVSDLVIGLGFGSVDFTLYQPIGKLNSPGDYTYFTLGTSFDKYSVNLGMHVDELAASPVGPGCPAGDVDCSPVHLDVSYAYSDNLSFTLSQFIVDQTSTDDLKVVVSYSLPLGE